MKKILSIIFVAMISTATFAQEAAATTDGMYPKKGDIAIGLDAAPFLNYAGNLLSGWTGQNTLNLNDQTIYGKYYIADDAAIRFSLSVDNSTDVQKNLVTDANAFAADPLTTKTVEDVLKTSSSEVAITLGYQKYRGAGRLKGYYGGQLGYMISKNNTIKNEWGNDCNINNPVVGRVITSKPNAESIIFLGPVAGIEYFVAPKISLGVDVSLMWGARMFNDFVETTTESWVAGARVEDTTVEDESARTTDINRFAFTSTANIFVMFHF